MALRRLHGGPVTVSGIGGGMQDNILTSGFAGSMASSRHFMAHGFGNIAAQHHLTRVPPLDPGTMQQNHPHGRLLTCRHNLLSMYKNRLLRGEVQKKKKAGLGSDSESRLSDEIRKRKKGMEDPETLKRREARRERRRVRQERRVTKRRAREERRQEKEKERERRLLDGEDRSRSSSSSSTSTSTSTINYIKPKRKLRDSQWTNCESQIALRSESSGLLHLHFAWTVGVSTLSRHFLHRY